MRRWNGWGDDSIIYHLPPDANTFLEGKVGAGKPPKDVKLEDVVAQVPTSRLPSHSLIKIDADDRVRHSCGQSLGDWIALRSGRVPAFPDGVAYPVNDKDVQDLIRFAMNQGIQLIPYGGGTSVAGHINPLPRSQPVLAVDMRRMKRLVKFDEKSGLATFEAGIAGPDLEAQLNAKGCTLGHFPQSFEYSTLGGWVATRSSGQQSLGYGRIEKLFAGGRMETPVGSMDFLPHPASAAGPDIREMVLGSEGRFGIITESIVRVTPLPEKEAFHGVFFPDFTRGIEAAKEIVQSRLPLSMIRLSTAPETETTLALAGHKKLIGALEGFLSLRGVRDGKCMLMLGFTGKKSMVKMACLDALGICKCYGGIHVGRVFGKQWQKNRFRSPYLRNTIWEAGYTIDTVETAVPWSNVPATIDAIENALRDGLKDVGERVFIFTHLSHFYPSGSGIYVTYLYRAAADPGETLRRWQVLKNAASKAIVSCRGTISHQHGVGIDHKPFLST
ncbi:MAG: FAD-binding oxidoreductase, partial [Syntrophales bacterium]